MGISSEIKRFIKKYHNANSNVETKLFFLEFFPCLNKRGVSVNKPEIVYE